MVEKYGIDEHIMQYDKYSMRTLLTALHNWSEEKVDYVETMTSQTREFDGSFVEILLENMTFNVTRWKTIKDGMSRLPEACAKIIGKEKIIMGAKVVGLSYPDEDRVTIRYKRGNEMFNQTFDDLILAVPPAVVRIMDRPRWSPTKEKAIRSVHFQPLYKIGLRFRSRFWERNATTPSCGGQSITDLPGRWIVYPSVGLGTDGEGVLLCYSWMLDALKWLPHSAEDQTQLALRDLSIIYGEKLIKREFIESKAVSWATEMSAGVAMFLPGQFTSYFNELKEREKNVYFAGEHLSVHHGWILGAINSSLSTVQDLLKPTPVEMLKPTKKVPTCAI